MDDIVHIVCDGMGLVTEQKTNEDKIMISKFKLMIIDKELNEMSKRIDKFLKNK